MGSDKEGFSQIEAPKGIIEEEKEEEEGNGKVKLVGAQEVKEEEQEYCKTPTGSGNRIPQIQNCPPPPRKRRRPLVASSSSSSVFKRRSFTDELHFFEESRLDELNTFFQSISMYEFSKVNKRCRSI